MSTKPNPSPDPIFTLRGHNAEVHVVKFSVSGEKLISGYEDVLAVVSFASNPAQGQSMVK